MSLCMTRRRLIGTTAGVTSLAWMMPGALATPAMIVHRDPSCGCCEDWVKHIRAAGIEAGVVSQVNMNMVKVRLGVPDALASCHTAEIGGYIVEEHVPAKAVLQLLRDQPDARGIAAPGMPVGSPGMESGDGREVFEVMLFGKNGVSVYGRYRGDESA